MKNEFGNPVSADHLFQSVGASMSDWEEYNKSLSNNSWSKSARDNARLVALAPELLAILEQLVDFWVHDTPVRNGSLDTIKARILVDMAHGITPDADLVEELEGYGNYFYSK
jgi:hypothetical protein